MSVTLITADIQNNSPGYRTTRHKKPEDQEFLVAYFYGERYIVVCEYDPVTTCVWGLDVSKTEMKWRARSIHILREIEAHGHPVYARFLPEGFTYKQWRIHWNVKETIEGYWD